MVGTTVSHYRVLGELGHGGMGVVYSAEDTMLGRKVALKFCSAATDPRLRKSLLKEAKAASALTHPNIAHIYEFGETAEGEPFIAMEYVPGLSLADLLRAGPLKPAEAMRIVGLVAQALKEAHSFGIVHRDIKPSNIRISDRNEVKVVDFGLAEPAAPPASDAPDSSEAATRTMERVIHGTPAYMSPEQARGYDVDHRSDLFSLGAVFYECLTGVSPFGARTKTDSLAKVIERDPPPPSTLKRGLNPALDRIVLKLLAKEANDRYQSAAEFFDALDAVPDRGWIRPPRLRAGALVLVLFSVATLAVFTAWRALRAPHVPPPEANSWYVQGIAAAESGSFHKASKMLDQAVAIDPNFAMAHALLAEVWNALDNSDRAQQEMLKAMAPGTRPRVSDTDWLRIQAIHSTLTRNFAEAARLYRELASRMTGRERVAALLDLGRVYDRDQKGNDALDAYLTATRDDPQSAAAFLQLGSLYVRRRDAQSARPALEKAESLYQVASDQEGLTECIYWRARLETDLDASLLLLERALAAAELSGSVQQIIRTRMLMSDRLAKRGDSVRASEEARLAVTQAESSGLENMTARAMIWVASALFQAGRTPLAIPFVERALEISRRKGAKDIEARANVNLGSMLFESGRRAEAIPLLQQALQFYKNGGYRGELTETLILLARARRDDGDYSGAAAGFRELIQTIGPSEKSVELALALEGLASVFVAQEHYPEALKGMLEARECYSSVKHKLGLLTASASAASLLATLGKRAEANRMLSEQAPVAASDGLVVREAAAIAALYGGDNEKARIGAADVIPSSDDAIMRCRMRWVSGLALTRSGRAREGYAECIRARDSAREFHNPAVTSDAALAAAEAAIAAGHSLEAERDLGSLQDFLEKSQKNDSLWRAWALLAGIRSGARRRDAIARAQASLTALRRAWSASDYETYTSRPDVRKLLNIVQIDKKE